VPGIVQDSRHLNGKPSHERDDMPLSIVVPQENQEEAAERDFFADYEAVTGASPLIFDSFDDALDALEGLL
jgi:hypothetical protein